MRRLNFILLSAALLVAESALAGGAAHAQTSTVIADGTAITGNLVDRSYVDARVAAAQIELEAARSACAGNAACASSAAGAALLRASRTMAALRGELTVGAYAGTYGASAGSLCPYTPRAGTRPDTISEAAFDSLKRTMGNHTVPDEKLRVLEPAADEHWFSAQQVRSLMASLDFSPQKFAVLTLLAPKLSDPENGRLLEAVFAGRSDQAHVREILANAMACPGLAGRERRSRIGTGALTTPTSVYPPGAFIPPAP